MTEQPTVLVTHEAPHQATPSEVADEIRNRDRQLDVIVASSWAETRRRIVDVEIVVTKHSSPALLRRSERLEWVHSMTSGLDEYDLGALANEGIALTSAAGVNADAVAEQALAFMLSFERNLLTAVDQHGRAEWQRYAAGELGERTVAIVGLGAVGSALASRAHALGMTVHGSKRDTSVSVSGVEKVYPAADVHDLVAGADYVVIACPLTEATRGSIDDRVFSSMKDDAVLINVARGEILDEDALLRAVQKGYLRGAALDVQREEPLPADHDLWNVPNVLITPHVAGSTPTYAAGVADTFVSLVERYREEPAAFLDRHVPETKV